MTMTNLPCQTSSLGRLQTARALYNIRLGLHMSILTPRADRGVERGRGARVVVMKTGV